MNKKLLKWSRNGCLTCKARKHKCDEHKPFCNECLRINMACVYWHNKNSSIPRENKKYGKLLNNETTVIGIGVVKILRAKVEYKIENGEMIYKA